MPLRHESLNKLLSHIGQNAKLSASGRQQKERLVSGLPPQLLQQSDMEHLPYQSRLEQGGPEGSPELDWAKNEDEFGQRDEAGKLCAKSV
jgi:hypothetical protein